MFLTEKIKECELSKKCRVYFLVGLILFLFLFLSTSYLFLFSAPRNFPIDSIYSLTSGTGLNTLAEDLSAKGIIRSVFWFKAFSVFFGGAKKVMAGEYILNEKEDVIALAKRFVKADYRQDLVKITIPEGLSIEEIANLFSQKFSKINSKLFKEEAIGQEGYLFPDTYLFLPDVEVETVLAEMRENFNKKISSLKLEIESFGRPISDVIKMASLVEEEARTFKTKQIVAGILWDRLDIGMPLQVDSSFKYINGKTTNELTTADLKIDSPYNSYLYKGLPPTPICNPGLDSIQATISPQKTDYLYFLTDSNGIMHYAKTYAKHLQNKELYLE